MKILTQAFFLLFALVSLRAVGSGQLDAIPPSNNTNWSVERVTMLSAVAPKKTSALRIGLPRKLSAEAGEMVSWQLELNLKDALSLAGTAFFQVGCNDSFTGTASGHVFARVRLGDTVLWSEDVGTLDSTIVEAEFDAERLTDENLYLEVYIARDVSNYQVDVFFSDPVIEVGDAHISLNLNESLRLSSEEIAPIESEPAIESVERMRPEWLDSSRALQPWSRTQVELMRNPEKWIPILRDRYKFNTLILASPDGHHGIVRDIDRLILSDEEYAHALKLFRDAGFNIIFYSSLIHCGHSTEWHEDFGDPATKLPSRYPEWLMRDADGNTINRYGGRWLSPLTPAFDYQVDYTIGEIEAWSPDGLMLDNHGFHFTNERNDFTGYGEGALEGFREYGVALGIGDAQSWELPRDPEDALYPFWLGWRNYAMAKVTEDFRREMREASGQNLLTANVAFDYPNAALGNDRLTQHLDALIAENKVTLPARLVSRNAYVRAISDNIPHWSYLGTFIPKQHDRLQTPRYIADQFSAGMASGALPWVVFYGFQSTEQIESLWEIEEQMKRWDFLQSIKPWGEPLGAIQTVVTPRERTFTGGLAIPQHVEEISATGRSVNMIDVRTLPNAELDTNYPLVLEGIQSMGKDEAEAILRFAKQGGTVYSTRNSGWFDVLGRWRDEGLLREGEKNNPIIFLKSSSDLKDTVVANTDSFAEEAPLLEWSNAYRTDDGDIWLHLGYSEPVGTGGADLILSPQFAGSTVSMVDFDNLELTNLGVKSEDDSIHLEDGTYYTVLKIEAPSASTSSVRETNSTDDCGWFSDINIENNGERFSIGGDVFQWNFKNATFLESLKLYDSHDWFRVLGDTEFFKLQITVQNQGTLHAMEWSLVDQQLVGDQITITFRTRFVDQNDKEHPWEATLSYRAYEIGAFFIDFTVACLSRNPVHLQDIRFSLPVLDGNQFAKFSDAQITKETPALPPLRYLVGQSEEVSYTNEIEIILENSADEGEERVEQSLEGGRVVWTVKGPESPVQHGNLWGYRYENRIAFATTAAATSSEHSDVIGARIFHWINFLDLANWYPSNDLLDEMARLGGTHLVLHHEWMQHRGSNGYPPANYEQIRDLPEFERTIREARKRGLKVLLYIRGVETYSLDAPVFQDTNNFDGIYVDWHGAYAHSHHDSIGKAAASRGDRHYSEDGLFVPAYDYFMFNRRMREIVGEDGVLMGHPGSFNSGVFANLYFDGYLAGETASERELFNNRDNAVRLGMMASATTMAWPEEASVFHEPEGAAKMAAWGIVPHILLGLHNKRTDTLFPLNPNAELNQPVFEYWNLLKDFDFSNVDVLNHPSAHTVRFSIQPEQVEAIAYRNRSTGEILLVAANLGESSTTAEISLAEWISANTVTEPPYKLFSISPETGEEDFIGTTETVIELPNLEQWDIAAFRLEPLNNNS